MSKIFVIDDSVGACVAIERMLTPQGFDVVWEKDAVTALRTIERHAPDLVICDIVLPEIDGFELCQSLRSNPLLDRVPVVLISGEVSDKTRERARACDAAAIVEKPFDVTTLVETVRNTLDGVVAASSDALEPTDEDMVPEALRQRLISELDGFAEIRCRLTCIANAEGSVIACNNPDSSALPPKAQRDLRSLCRLATDALHNMREGSRSLRLTVELEDRVRLVEALEGGWLLVIEVEDLSNLGKARFLMRRLRPRLVSMLHAD